MKNFVISLSVLMVAALLLTGCGRGAQTASDGLDEKMYGYMTVDVRNGVSKRNGTDTRTYQVAEGEQGVLKVNVSKESGKLGMAVYNKSDLTNPSYEEYDLDSQEITLDLENPGEYIVWITADDYVGNYWFDVTLAGKDV